MRFRLPLVEVPRRDRAGRFSNLGRYFFHPVKRKLLPFAGRKVWHSPRSSILRIRYATTERARPIPPKPIPPIPLEVPVGEIPPPERYRTVVVAETDDYERPRRTHTIELSIVTDRMLSREEIADAKERVRQSIALLPYDPTGGDGPDGWVISLEDENRQLPSAAPLQAEKIEWRIRDGGAERPTYVYTLGRERLPRGSRRDRHD